MTALRVVGTQLSDPVPMSGANRCCVLGPSLGTSAVALWTAWSADLADRFHVVGWDLPGHGVSRADDRLIHDLPTSPPRCSPRRRGPEARGEPTGPFAYAGDSAGGAAGLQLLVDAPDRVRSAVILCSSATFGAMPGWTDRAAAARASGTASLVTALGCSGGSPRVRRP